MGPIEMFNFLLPALPGYDGDSACLYRLRRPLYGMPSAARSWQTTIDECFPKMEGMLNSHGFEHCMRTFEKDGHRIIMGVQ